jgi:isopenicillin-N epimerase
MQVGRRTFLSAVAASGAAGAVARVGAAPAVLDASASADWTWVRAQFDASPDWAHFSSFLLASHPRAVREEIARIRTAIDENPPDVVEHGMFERPEAVRQAAAAYLGGRAEDVALTRSTTEGLAAVYAGLPLAPGDEILTTPHDHYSHHEAIRLAARRAGAAVRRAALYGAASEARAGDMIERLRSAIRPATRAIGVTWVHSSTGVKLPVRGLAAMVREQNRSRAEADRILLIVDGAHGFGVEDEDVAGLGCDFFCAGTHKWMLGPRGTGIVWGRSEAWQHLQPTVPAFEMAAFQAWEQNRDPGPTRAAFMSPGGFQAFEHTWALPSAFQFHAQLGRARIAARLLELNTRMKDGLSAIPRVTVHTPRDPETSAALVCFEVEGMRTQDVVARLRERRILASAAPYPVSYARLAGSLLNTAREVDAAVAAVGALAARRAAMPRASPWSRSRSAG